MGETCIYCESTVDVWLGRCEDCAVAEFDAENAHGRSPWSQPFDDDMARVIAASRYSKTYNVVSTS